LLFWTSSSFWGSGLLPPDHADLPKVQQPLSQARITQAYVDVRRLSIGVRVTSVARPETGEVDRWIQVYQFASADESIVRLMLTGLSQVSPESGLDSADIHSEMPASPTASFV
jgi:hypothetical protein